MSVAKTLNIVFLILFFAFIVGIICAIKYFKKTSRWQGKISNQEYWSCLAFGWCSLMLVCICGLFLLFGIFMQIIFLFSYYKIHLLFFEDNFEYKENF